MCLALLVFFPRSVRERFSEHECANWPSRPASKSSSAGKFVIEFKFHQPHTLAAGVSKTNISQKEMGICLSCLRPKQTVQEDENASLLSDDKAKAVEDELLTELRNKQLNAILNSTNDHLIDISTFKSMSNYGSQHTDPNNNGEGEDTNSQIQQEENDVFKVIPISQSQIQDEMDQQYNNWISQLGESTVRKYMEVKENPVDKKRKYSVDLV